jgi:CDP-diacylglycerol--serine O-phosphatidyltransferase
MLAGLMVSLLKSSTTLLIACVGMAILMLSELPLPSLKFKHFRWQGNQVIYLLGGIGAVLAVLYGILAVPLILVLYVLSPLWGRVFPKGV